jgi:hypothetical protein
MIDHGASPNVEVQRDEKIMTMIRIHTLLRSIFGKGQDAQLAQRMEEVA